MPHAQNDPPETWSPARRAAAAIASPIRRILAIEAASGVVLLVATAVALIWANVWTASYALRMLLLALAVIDDIGAIIVIAVFYGAGVSLHGFAVVGFGIAAVLAMRAAGVRTPLLYVVPGAVVWVGLLATGIHPTIGGVLLGLLTPVRPWFGPSGFAATTREQLERLPDGDHQALLSSLDLVNQARREAVSPVERLIHALLPWVAFVVMPIFALANAGVVRIRTHRESERHGHAGGRVNTYGSGPARAD